MVTQREIVSTQTMLVRQATLEDLPFLIECIKAAESSGTGKVSYAQIFKLKESELVDLLTQLCEDDSGQFEHSYKSFYILLENGKYAAAASAWVEGDDGLPSGTLKAQYVSFILGFDRWREAANTLKKISEINIPREQGTLQLDGFHTVSELRGRGLVNLLIQGILDSFLTSRQDLKKAQIILMDRNLPAIRAYEKSGFERIRTTHSDEAAIPEMLLGSGKVLMERYF